MDPQVYLSIRCLPMRSEPNFRVRACIHFLVSLYVLTNCSHLGVTLLLFANIGNIGGSILEEIIAVLLC